MKQKKRNTVRILRKGKEGNEKNEERQKSNRKKSDRLLEFGGKEKEKQNKIKEVSQKIKRK